jgi:hypothetical protein
MLIGVKAFHFLHHTAYTRSTLHGRVFPARKATTTNRSPKRHNHSSKICAALAQPFKRLHRRLNKNRLIPLPHTPTRISTGRETCPRSQTLLQTHGPSTRAASGSRHASGGGKSSSRFRNGRNGLNGARPPFLHPVPETVAATQGMVQVQPSSICKRPLLSRPIPWF